jgi:hypothetical protein
MPLELACQSRRSLGCQPIGRRRYSPSNPSLIRGHTLTGATILPRFSAGGFPAVSLSASAPALAAPGKRIVGRASHIPCPRLGASRLGCSTPQTRARASPTVISRRADLPWRGLDRLAVTPSRRARNIPLPAQIALAEAIACRPRARDLYVALTSERGRRGCWARRIRGLAPAARRCRPAKHTMLGFAL